MVISGEATCRQGPLAVVAVMPQRLPVRSSRDDWTGVTSAAKRRKLQNRLNQRAYRARKRAEYRLSRTTSEAQSICSASPGGNSHIVGPATEGPTASGEQGNMFQGYILFPPSAARQKVLAFGREAYESYILGTHRPSQLHLLVKLNVLNAVARNAALLGFPADSLCTEEMISAFSLTGPARAAAGHASYPRFLQPTPTQRSVAHHPFIDLFPFPVMRDRALRAIESGLLDEDELCYDLLELDGDRSAEPSLIVWGDGSEPSGWEASEPFLEKYGWLVWGCHELFEATNRWRARRGERCLRV